MSGPENFDVIKMAPAFIPFGHGMVMTASGLKDGIAFVVVRAVADKFVGELDVSAAWEANELNGGPVWFLSFATPESLTKMADMCSELADALAKATP